MRKQDMPEDMPQKKMDLQRLGEICEAYGQDPGRWPVQERVMAEAFVAGSADARRLLDEAARLDQWLDEAPSLAQSLAPSPALRARILAAAPQRRRRFELRMPEFMMMNGNVGWRYAIPALFVALILGMALGGSGSTADVLDQSDLLQIAVFQNDLDAY